MSTIDLVRLCKAVHLEVQPVAPDRYLITGGRDDHVVVIRDGRVICDCLDSQFTGDNCKHSLATRLHSGDPVVVKALRQLVPNPRRFPAKRRQGAA